MAWKTWIIELRKGETSSKGKYNEEGEGRDERQKGGRTKCRLESGKRGVSRARSVRNFTEAALER